MENNNTKYDLCQQERPKSNDFIDLSKMVKYDPNCYKNTQNTNIKAEVEEVVIKNNDFLNIGR